MKVVVPSTFKNISSFLSFLGFIFIIVALVILLFEDGLFPRKLYSFVDEKLKVKKRK